MNNQEKTGLILVVKSLKNEAMPSQKEQPMIHSYEVFKSKIENDMKVIRCKIKAIIKYQEASAKAAKKLAGELKKCDKAHKSSGTSAPR